MLPRKKLSFIHVTVKSLMIHDHRQTDVSCRVSLARELDSLLQYGIVISRLGTSWWLTVLGYATTILTTWEDLRLANAAMMIALEYIVHCSSSPKDASLRSTYSLQIDGTIKIGQRCCKQLFRRCVRIIGQTLSVSILCVELWRKSDGTSGKRENSCHSKSIISTSIIEVEVLYFCQEWAEAGGY